MALNRNLPPVPVSTFAMVPRADVPRSTFKTVSAYKTTFDADYLIPFFVEEVLPGDHFKGDATIFVRMSTPVFPIMDNLYVESFFFFVPNRLTWANWVRFMGEQDSPADSISFNIPQVTSSATGFLANTPADYFGLPVQDAHIVGLLSVNALPFRAYNMIYNEWFRDENLTTPATETTADASQAETVYPLRKRAKRPDYFTSALPWPLKGGVDVKLPMAGSAVVKTSASITFSGVQQQLAWNRADTGGAPTAGPFQASIANAAQAYTATAAGATTAYLYPANLYADLTTATGATINAMRLAVATQQFLEKDARGGTRYAELLRNHFGVTPQDARLDRPEYIGGGSNMLNTQAIPQTTTAIAPATTTVGALGGATVGSGRHRFSYAASEHGFIIGLVNVRADITYQHGIHRMWTRYTRLEFYWPTFAFLGEQAVRQDELYAKGNGADYATFGYQERWAEYRYRPSRITGKFRSLPTAGTLDAWHLAENFTTDPALNSTFILSNTPISRVVAAGVQANNQQFLLDSVWHITATRCLPARSVPGLTRF
ncbi:MAG: major capsid protein [Arizlama microvirus]|nr:MAG: major capsid protein [Arizlama microvirus]